MDDEQSLSWLFAYKRFKLVCYLEKAQEMRKQALYRDKLSLQNLFSLKLKLTIAHFRHF